LQWLKWLGLNPLFIFVAMIWLEVVLMVNVRFYVDNEKWTYWNFISNYAFSTWLINEDLSSLVVSIVHLGLWVAVAYYLFVKKIFIKLWRKVRKRIEGKNKAILRKIAQKDDKCVTIYMNLLINITLRKKRFVFQIFFLEFFFSFWTTMTFYFFK